MNALRDRQFRRLLVGQSLSNFGDSALYLGLAIWAKDLTGSNSSAGLVFLALGAASLLAPLGGYFVDRVRRRRSLLMFTDGITALVVCALILVDSRGQLWILYVVAFIYGLSANIIGPATTALLRDMLPDDDLGSSNAVRQTLSQGLRLLSPVVGAAIFASAGGGALAVFDAATFLASILAVASLRMVETPPPAKSERLSLLVEVRAGFKHIYTQIVLRRLCAVSAVAMLVIGFYESIDFAVVAALGHPPSFFGVLMTVQAAGSIAGGVLVTSVMRRLSESRTVAVGLACFAVASIGLAVRDLAVVFSSLVLLGAGVTFFIVGLYTAQQRLTPARLQGRVSAASYVITDIPQTISIGVGAALIGFVDYRILLSGLALVTVGCAVILLRKETQAQEPIDDPAVTPSMQSRRT